MAKKPYVPFHVRQAKGEEQYSVLHEGVPEWMWPSLWRWCEQQLWTGNPMGGGADLNKEIFQYLERVLRVKLKPGYNDLRQQMAENHDLFLSTADALLQLSLSCGGVDIQALEKILEEAGSAFEVSQNDDGYFLQHRVAPPVKKAYEETLPHAGRASHYLQEAWQHIYRRKPDASASYSQAVKAVEAVAGPLLLPKDSSATLGKVIKRMKDAPEKFEVHLQPHDGDAIGKVRALCELIWKSQLDRHGTDDPQVPLKVSKEAAEMALHAAVTLVHWFSRGMIKLKS